MAARFSSILCIWCRQVRADNDVKLMKTAMARMVRSLHLILVLWGIRGTPYLSSSGLGILRTEVGIGHCIRWQEACMHKPLRTAMLFFALFSFGIAHAAQDGAGTLSDAVSWLEKESHRIIRASRRTM